MPAVAAAYGAELGINRVYVFPISPVFSAFGVASSDVVHTKLVTRHLVAPIDMEVLNDEIQRIETDLMRAMEGEGFSAQEITFRRILYMRYTRQVNEVGVQAPGGYLSNVDRGRIDPRLLHRRPHHPRRELCRVHARQRAVLLSLPHRRPYGGDNHRFFELCH